MMPFQNGDESGWQCCAVVILSRAKFNLKA